MASYGNYTAGSRGKRVKRLVIGVVCSILIVLAAVYIIGLVAGVNGERGQEISAAVSENVNLRREVSDKDDEIERLNNEINSLKAQLENRQTPEPSTSPQPSAEPKEGGMYRYSDEEEYLSPRSGDSDYDDD